MPRPGIGLPSSRRPKEQFANSPDLTRELVNAIIGALDDHSAMSTQALNSERVRRDVLLNHAGLYEMLRVEGQEGGGTPAQRL